MRSFRAVMTVVIIVCILPFVSLMLAIAVADLGHCRLDEGGVYPCVIAGVDLGAMLSIMSVMGWLGLATLPVLGIAVLVWIVVELVRRLRRRMA